MHLQGVYVGYQWSNLNPTALMRINYKGGRSWMLMENNRRILSVSGRDLLVACKMTNFKQIRRQAVGFLWLEKMVTSKIRMRKGCHFNFQGTGNDEKLMLVIWAICHRPLNTLVMSHRFNLFEFQACTCLIIDAWNIIQLLVYMMLWFP